MLNNTYSKRVGSPTAGDLIAPSIFNDVGGNVNYFGTSAPLNHHPHHLYDIGMVSQPPPPPRRRYSIGGLPSASMTEYLHLMEQNNLSNLLNETKTSITRSSQLLSRGEDLSTNILLSSAVGDTIANLNLDSTKAVTDAEIAASNILNQLPIGANTSYSSNPNIYYSQPNYGANQLFATNVLPTQSYDYFSRYKRPPSALSYELYSKTYNNPNSYTNPYINNYSQHKRQYHQYNYPSSRYYNQSPPPYSSSLPHHYNHHRPMHYTSNPALSQSSNYYLKHPHHYYNSYHNSANNTSANIANNTSTSASYLYHQHPYSGYSNQHFDLHHHLNSNNNCYSKLDLDYMKQTGEQTKRQVSFNVDVDTLSIDS